MRDTSGRGRACWLVLTLLAGSAIASPALAQQPGGGQSGTIEGQARPPQLPSAVIAPFVIEKPAAGAPASAVRILVRQIVVDGVTVIDKARVDAAVAGYTGREVTFAELAQAADAITRLYTDAGYALSFAIIPEQTVRDGVVRMVVVEGRIDQVLVQMQGRGALVSRDRIAAAVKARVEALVDGRPVRIADLEREIFEIADLAGMSVSVVVRPSRSVESAADLVVQLGSDPFQANLSAYNRLRFEFGREAVTAGLTFNSVLTTGDALDIVGRSAFDTDAYVFWNGRYETSIGATAARAYLSGSHAQTEAQAGLLGFLGFLGEETAVRAGVRYPLIRSRARNLYLQGELYGVDTSSTALGVVLIEDRVRTAEIDLVADWAGRRGASALARIGVIQGIDGLGATPAGNPLASRLGGSPDFTAVVARYYRDQPVGAGWRIKLDLDGQSLVSGQALAPVECSYGGEQFGRAYDAGAIGGDHCLRYSLEGGRAFRLGERMVLAPYAFFDGAMVRQAGALSPGESRTTSAESTGLGVRALLPRRIVIDALAARPLDPAFAERGDDIRYYLSIGARF